MEQILGLNFPRGRWTHGARGCGTWARTCNGLTCTFNRNQKARPNVDACRPVCPVGTGLGPAVLGPRCPPWRGERSAQPRQSRGGAWPDAPWEAGREGRGIGSRQGVRALGRAGALVARGPRAQTLPRVYEVAMEWDGPVPTHTGGVHGGSGGRRQRSREAFPRPEREPPPSALRPLPSAPLPSALGPHAPPSAPAPGCPGRRAHTLPPSLALDHRQVPKQRRVAGRVEQPRSQGPVSSAETQEPAAPGLW